MKVRIVSTPAGEAPLHIREAWSGLELPVSQGSLVYYLGQGILTGAWSWVGRLFALLRGRVNVGFGYPVIGAEAIAVLERSNPDAAKWWRENAAHVLQPGRVLVFRAESCAPIRSADERTSVL